MKKIVTFIKKLDNRKSKKYSKKRKVKYNRWLNVIHNHLLEKIVELIKQAKKNNKNHLVLEDLKLLKRFLNYHKELNIKNSRLIKMLHLTSLKTRIRRIAHRYGLNVSFINPQFTSQTCNVCGNINKNNRISQEEFLCKNCNSSLNADYNASLNIVNRIKLDVLKNKLLNYDGVEYNPKNISHFNVKQILLEFG